MKLYELALHKSSTKSINDFAQQINTFRNSGKLELKQLVSKLYFQIPNTNIGIPASTFVHDAQKHSITVDDWNRLFSFIASPELFVEAKYSKAFRGQNFLYKYYFDNKFYGLGACKTKRNWLITTFFEADEPSIDNWLIGNGKTPPEVPTAADVPGCSLSEGFNPDEFTSSHTNSIHYFEEDFNLHLKNLNELTNRLKRVILY